MRKAPKKPGVLALTAAFLLVIMFLALVFSIDDSRHPSSSVGSSPTSETQQIVDRLNEARRFRHIAPFRRLNTLAVIADGWARHMADVNRMFHGPYATRIWSGGFVGHYVGEVIAKRCGGPLGARKVVRLWLKSPPHRHVILDPDFHLVGTGIATNSAGCIYIAADVGARQYHPRNILPEQIDRLRTEGT